MRLAVVFLLLTIPVFFTVQSVSAPPIDKPDLAVVFISQTPRYPTLHGKVEYNDHHLPKLTKPEYEKIKKFFPEKGETVTFTANFLNKGAPIDSEVDYVWKIDGKEVKSGKTKVTGYSTVSQEKLKWVWEDGPHTVTFELDPDGKVEDFFRENNTKTDRTDSLGFHFSTTRQTYERWNANKNFIGTYSFEDWVNWHFDEMNREFEQAVHPSTPDGCNERVRMDTFAVVEDGAELEKLDRSNFSGYWTFVSNAGEGWIREDMALIHELGHQIGLVDYYLITLHLFANQLPDMHGQPALEGYSFRQASECNMFSPGARKWCEVCAAALNRQKGYPKGYYGTYLFDHADNYLIRVLDKSGNVLPEAQITYYRYIEGPRKEQEGVADKQGLLRLNNHDIPRYKIPHSPFEIKPTPFGRIRVVGVDSVLCFHVRARGQEDFIMTDTVQFLIENWRNPGSKEVVFDIKTRIGSPDAPKPPQKVSALWKDSKSAGITWTSSESQGTAKYNIYIQRMPQLWAHHLSPPVIVAEGLEGTEYIYNYTGDPDKGDMRFYVTAVDENGNESGPSRKMWLPYPPALNSPVHIIYDPIRGRYMLSGCSRLTGIYDDVGFRVLSWHLGTRGMAWNPDGTLLVAQPGSNLVALFDPEIWMDTYPVLSYTSAGGLSLKSPEDAAGDGRGNTVIADTGNGRVLVISRKMELIAVLGGEGGDDGKIVRPVSVAIIPDGRIVVGDAGTGELMTCRINIDGSVSYLPLPVISPEPVDIQVDSTGNLIVLDREDKTVKSLSTPDYRDVRVLASGLINPSSCAIGRNGTLMIYDSGREGMDAFVEIKNAFPEETTYYALSIPREKFKEFSVVPPEIAKKHRPLIETGKWHIIGPFDNTDGTGFDTVYPPENEDRIDVSKQYEGVFGEKISWKIMPPRACADGELINFLTCFSKQNFVLAYASTTIISDAERKVRVLTGSDDTITMWVNGDNVLSKNVLRVARRDEDVTDVTLIKGENRFLFKICQATGGWILFFRIVDPETGETIFF